MSLTRSEEPVCEASEFRQRLPATRLVDRCAFLIEKSLGKRVIHVGFADSGFREEHEGSGAWLHARLSEAARELVGIDIDEREVELAKRKGYEAYCGDCSSEASVKGLGLEPAKVMIAGEVLEHVDNAGDFLRALHSLTGEAGVLIVTTPNAHGWLNPVAAGLGYEFVNPDHVAVYSCFTLSKILQRSGWSVDEILTYALPGIRKRSGRKITERIQAGAARWLLLCSRTLAHRKPFVADGLIAVCSSV